ncbi:ParB-like nuclease domain-containing protein [Escherichia coli]|nr:ParB-like nuclease domain-containing protein [Escherichia coli]ELE2988877.1 ParB-like nuclease domain-containing protein [Escherichia coli]MBB8328755.1 ParB-like nuclease domain-containing protein [Escherichia coli]HAX2039637.1 ParB-like nuclease domain-containing protein [Escherichia coli]HAX2086734.1 ParB-like nuclease domain-containing protein [Escherichia coli]
MSIEQIINEINVYLNSLKKEDERIDAINKIKIELHRSSPFYAEPVDCVIWIKNNLIEANDYNPNVMAPSEKRLLIHSLLVDGFTQPVVTLAQKGKYTVIDGFHRQMLGKSTTKLEKKLKGYLPVTCIKHDNNFKAYSIASTIRHNRARGKHQIDALSDIVRDLSRMGWDDLRIGSELGMDTDEVLRLKQISGLTELFEEENFSPAWTIK